MRVQCRANVEKAVSEQKTKMRRLLRWAELRWAGLRWVELSGSKFAYRARGLRYHPQRSKK